MAPSWTQADVDAINARRGTKLPAHVPPKKKWSTKPQKGHKYRAVPCIVSADLTLYTKDDIQKLTLLARTLALPAKCSLKDAAKAVGIIGEWFGSTKEAKRWIELKHMAAAGRVSALKRQIPFPLIVNDITIGRWIADFTYLEYPDASGIGLSVREDSKGVRTPLYKRTKAHVEAQYGFAIRET